MRNPKHWLHLAEVIDAMRIIPRIFLTACFLWTVDITHLMLAWYFKLPATERGVEASGFASVVFLTVFGFMRLVYTTYSSSGRDWNQSPPKDPAP
jgi:hypothetical protein